MESHAALPVMVYGNAIGCVYISDVDYDQGAIIQALETNILRLSFGIEAVLVGFSVVFALRSSRKMRQISLT